MAVTDPRTADDEERGGFGTLGSAMGLLVLAWAAAIASFPLNDNSFFTHLATGRIILDRTSVPSSDPYTFTAQGEDWTVQSWLASVAYAGAERLGGEVGLRLLVLVVYVVAALLLWRLARAAQSAVIRLLIVFVALLVATGLWAERPYMIGVIGMAVLWLALEGSIRPWLLVPFMWIWANTHGSYPLGIVLVATVLAGEALDRRRHRARGEATGPSTDLTTEVTVLKATIVGTLAAMIGPLGIDAILFPIKAVTQSELLAQIVEWQPPGFRSLAERAFLALALVTLVALARDGRWRFILPTVVFVGAAVVAQRNVVMATMVLVPVLAACVPTVGELTSRSRLGLGPAFTAFSGLAAVGAVVLVVTSTAVGLGAYPTNALSWLDARNGSDGRLLVATQDFTGNLLAALDGGEGTVFIDDRADMYPDEVYRDYLSLERGEPEWATILDSFEIDVVVWERSDPLASLVAGDHRWQTVFADSEWLVACRRDRGPCEALAG